MKPTWVQRLEEALHVGPSRMRKEWWHVETKDICFLFFPPLLPLPDVVHRLIEGDKGTSATPTCAIRASMNSIEDSLVVMSLRDFLELYRLYITARRELEEASHAD